MVTKLVLFLLLVSSAQAVDIKVISAAASLAASSGQIVKETHDLFTHPWKTLKKHGSDLKKAAVKGQVATPPPNPVTVPVQSEEKK